MARIVCFSNQKGGVGKTTLAVHKAAAIQEIDNKVLFIDLDPQGNATRWISARALTDNPEQGEGYTRTVDLFNEDMGTFRPYTGYGGIDLVWTRKNDRELNDMSEVPMDTCITVANHIRTISDDYDWVFIDTPPTLSKLQVAALLSSDYVVCPVKLSGFGLDGIEGLIDTISQVQEHANPDLHLLGIVLNQAASNSTDYAKDVQELRDMVGDLVFENSVANRRPMDAACSQSKPVWKIRSGAAHIAKKEIHAVIKEIFQRVEDYEEQTAYEDVV